MLNTIRIVIAGVFMLGGMFIFFLSTLGLYRFRYVINRMHAAAMCDTLAPMLTLLGLCIFCGFTFHMLKLILIIIFLWLTSPVCSHLITKAEVMIYDRITQECEVIRK